MAIETIGIEVGKALILYGLQELMRAGMTEAEAKAYMEKVRAEFYAIDPNKIPDQEG